MSYVEYGRAMTAPVGRQISTRMQVEAMQREAATAAWQCDDSASNASVSDADMDADDRFEVGAASVKLEASKAFSVRPLTLADVPPALTPQLKGSINHTEYGRAMTLPAGRQISTRLQVEAMQ